MPRGDGTGPTGAGPGTGRGKPGVVKEEVPDRDAEEAEELE